MENFLVNNFKILYVSVYDQTRFVNISVPTDRYTYQSSVPLKMTIWYTLNQLNNNFDKILKLVI